MTKISMTTDLDVSADEVWKLIGGFNNFLLDKSIF
jgi:hypothetical protein